MKSIFTYIILSLSFLAVSCGSMQSPEAELLESAKYEFSHQRYDNALGLLDTLRTRYPEAIDLRRQAIALRQDIARAQVEERIERCRIEARDASREYTQARMDVAKKGAQVGKQDERRLVRCRVKADSLRIVYDTEMAKMEYIDKVKKKK